MSTTHTSTTPSGPAPDSPAAANLTLGGATGAGGGGATLTRRMSGGIGRSLSTPADASPQDTIASWMANLSVGSNSALPSRRGSIGTMPLGAGGEADRAMSNAAESAQASVQDLTATAAMASSSSNVQQQQQHPSPQDPLAITPGSGVSGNKGDSSNVQDLVPQVSQGPTTYPLSSPYPPASMQQHSAPYYPSMMVPQQPQQQQQPVQYQPPPNYGQQRPYQPQQQQQQLHQLQQPSAGQQQAAGDAPTLGPPRHRSIWVGNISEKATRDDLVHLFGSFPGYLDLYYMKQTRSAFVNMATDEAVEEGALHFHGQVFRGSRLICRSRLQKTPIASSTGNTASVTGAKPPGHSSAPRMYPAPGSVPTPPPMITPVGSASYIPQLAGMPSTSQQNTGSGSAGPGSSGGQWMLVPTAPGFAYHQSGASGPSMAQPVQPPAAATPPAHGYYPYFGYPTPPQPGHPGSAPSFGSPPLQSVAPQGPSNPHYPMYNIPIPGAMPMGMTVPVMMQAAPTGPPAASAAGGVVGTGGDMARSVAYAMAPHQHQHQQQSPASSSSSSASPQQQQQQQQPSDSLPSTSVLPRVPPPRVLNQPGGIGWVPIAAYLSAAAQVTTPTGLPAPTPLGIQVPLPIAIPGMGAVGGGSPSNRYFIIKSLSLDDLELSMKYRLWSPQVHLEAVLDLAFKTAENVYLIFSVNKSGEFFGFARMSTGIGQGPVLSWSIQEGSRRNALGGVFGVEWQVIQRLPFSQVRYLHNPWNAGKEIKVSRDGTELEPSLGHQLLTEFYHFQDAQSALASQGQSPQYPLPKRFASYLQPYPSNTTQQQAMHHQQQQSGHSSAATAGYAHGQGGHGHGREGGGMVSMH